MSLECAIETARHHLPIQRAIVRREFRSGYTIVVGVDGLHHVYSSNAWTPPTEAPMLPWAAPVGTPVAVVALDGSVTMLPTLERVAW